MFFDIDLGEKARMRGFLFHVEMLPPHPTLSPEAGEREPKVMKSNSFREPNGKAKCQLRNSIVKTLPA